MKKYEMKLKFYLVYMIPEAELIQLAGNEPTWNKWTIFGLMVLILLLGLLYGIYDLQLRTLK